MLLTIAIPTFNRTEALRERLEQFSSLDSGLSSKVELIICDNGSVDFKVPNFIGKLKVNYFQNPSNLGLGGNLEQCIKNARGEFVWLLSDDDHVQVNHLEELVIRLQETNADAIALSHKASLLSAQKMSENREEIPNFWKDFIFISGCIFRTNPVQRFISQRLNGEINPTYHQVLIALGMFVNGSLLENFTNSYVEDTNTHKNYRLQSAYVVRIHDLVRLEKQLHTLGITSAQLQALVQTTNSHILNYVPRIIFEFSDRKDFIVLLRLLWKSHKISSKNPKRLLLLYFSFFLAALAFADFRVARMSVYVFTAIFRKNLLPNELRGFSRKLPSKGSREASTLGYEAE